jgi:hypothetical protein
MKDERIMNDERIETTRNRIAARGFFIMYFLLLISLNYRMWILKQDPREYWDFIAIFFVVCFYGSIAFANKGVFDHNFKRLWLGVFIGTFIGISIIFFFIRGQIHSFVEVGVFLINFLLGLGLVIAVAYLLNRRWKRKEGIEDEK